MAERPERRQVRRQYVGLVELVAVFLADSRKACVEVGRRIRGPHHADCVRKARVHCPHEIPRRNGLREEEVPDEPARVHACVGPGRAIDADWRALQRLQRLLDHLLHANRVFLILPPRVARPVVGDDDSVLASIWRC